MSPLEQLLYESCKKINVELNEKQISQFMDYKDMLLEWNEKMNLTAITDEREIMLKHFADCLMICSDLDLDGKRSLMLVRERDFRECRKNSLPGSTNNPS